MRMMMIRMMRWAKGFALGLALLAGPAGAACADARFEGISYTACTFDPATADMRLFHRDGAGAVYGQFATLRRAVEAEGLRLIAAMNGAMYHPDLDVVGYYVEDGAEVAPLVTRAGPGNFGLVPNGVFCLRPDAAEIIETGRFAATPRACEYAMQSGPLLVEQGALHPRLLPGSDSRFTRNAVGVRGDGTVVWAITSTPLNLHRFARLMRDGLGAPDALYVDGRVSRLYAPELERSDFGFPVGPILGVVAPRD